MRQYVFGRSVQGASHIRSETECQDSHKKVVLDDGAVILAVADGHGSKSCPYSKTGSRIAVNVFCDTLQGVYKGEWENPDQLPSYLNREGDTKISKAIDAEWKRRVLERHKKNKREIPKKSDGEDDLDAVYKQYGSTLLGLLITQTFVFGFQLGDGDICYVTDDGLEMVVEPEKILGVETHSLSRKDSWEKAITVVRMLNVSDKLPAMFSLSSDGYANSYKSEADFHAAVKDYLSMLKEHGVKAISESIQGWLAETSEMGCGDDITMLIAYYAAEDPETETSPDPATETAAESVEEVLPTEPVPTDEEIEEGSTDG